MYYFLCVCVCVCVCVRVCACVRARVCVCVCIFSVFVICLKLISSFKCLGSKYSYGVIGNCASALTAFPPSVIVVSVADFHTAMCGDKLQQCCIMKFEVYLSALQEICKMFHISSCTFPYLPKRFWLTHCSSMDIWDTSSWRISDFSGVDLFIKLSFLISPQEKIPWSNFWRTRLP
jgi:hypothetical protein